MDRTFVGGVLALAAMICLPAEAAEYMRADVTVGAQTDAADVVVVGTITALEDAGREVIASVSVSEGVKGSLEVDRVRLFARTGDSLSPTLRIGEAVLLFLAQREDGRGYELLRGPRSLFPLNVGGATARDLARARLERVERPGAFRSLLVEAVAGPNGQLATDASLDLVWLAAAGEQFTPWEAETLVDVLATDRAKLEDQGHLIRLVGRLDVLEARSALLSTLGDAGRFPYAVEIAGAVVQDGEALSLLAYGLTHDPSAQVRRNTARVLAEVGDARVVDSLTLAAVGDSDLRARSEALLALESTGQASVLGVLLETLFSQRSLLERKAAAVGLARQGREGALALKDAQVADQALDAFLRLLRSSPSRAEHEVLRALR